MMKKVIAALIFILTAVTGAAPAVVADQPVEGRAGRSEARFLEGMIDHHQMALDMAADCLGKAQTTEVTTVCQAIIDAQGAEIELMQGWLLDWYGIQYTPVSITDMLTLPQTATTEMHHGGAHSTAPVTDPPMTMGMFAGFNRLEGIDYEIAWLESMIDHHDDAIHMSRRALRTAEHSALRELAQAIIDAQTTEIDNMENLIAVLAE
jgi:uncharacterized protein (DUF305 family)